jgi:diaminobutyrate-2-oxoglutarate transaminase
VLAALTTPEETLKKGLGILEAAAREVTQTHKLAAE